MAQGAAPPASSSLVRTRSLPEDGSSRAAPAVLGIKGRVLSPPSATPSPAAFSPAVAQQSADAMGAANGHHDANAALPTAADGGSSTAHMRSAPPPGFGPLATAPGPLATQAAPSAGERVRCCVACRLCCSPGDAARVRPRISEQLRIGRNGRE